MNPQHLQQADLYHESLLSARLGAMTPYDWGVVEMEVDEKALAAGQLQLLRFFGILPDGTARRPSSAASPRSPPGRPIEEHFGASKKSLDVYLGVARERDGVASYGDANGSTTAPRFSVVSRSVADLITTESVSAVAFAQRNIRLLFGTEPREDYEVIKIGELVRDKTGAAVLSPTYIPPCLRISASPYILASLRQLLKSMHGKQRELSDTRPPPGRGLAGVHRRGRDEVPPAQRAQRTHPPGGPRGGGGGHVTRSSSTCCLCQAAGQLSTFSADSDPANLPKFQYTNLRATFEGLFRALDGLLRSVALEQSRRHRRSRSRKDGMHLGRLEDERLARCTQFILAVKSRPAARAADRGSGPAPWRRSPAGTRSTTSSRPPRPGCR